MKRNGRLLCFWWIFILLFTTAVSPSYLVEGLRNHLGFVFSSKEAYVITVNLVQAGYVLVYAILTLVTVVVLYRCIRQKFS